MLLKDIQKLGAIFDVMDPGLLGTLSFLSVEFARCDMRVVSDDVHAFLAKGHSPKDNFQGLFGLFRRHLEDLCC